VIFSSGIYSKKK